MTNLQHEHTHTCARTYLHHTEQSPNEWDDYIHSKTPISVLNGRSDQHGGEVGVVLPLQEQCPNGWESYIPRPLMPTALSEKVITTCTASGFVLYFPPQGFVCGA